ncbi:MAG: serine hydrolase domain-containing protein [Pseudomonadota bacterium]
MAAGLLLAAPAVKAAEVSDAALAPIVAVHESQDNVGLAVVFRDRDGLIVEQYVGDAVVEHEVPVTARSRFQVMSITKAFVGAALVKSLTAGRVALDAPVQDYLPDYPRPESGVITLRRLAAHTAGLPHLGHPDRRALYLEHFDTAAEALQPFADLPLLFEPGTDYAYSSSNYNLIAAVLETVYERPFPEVLNELVLTPLSLRATRPGNVNRPEPDLVRNYAWMDVWTYAPTDSLQQVPTWDFSYNVGGGNLVTTAPDLARFGAAFLAPGFFSEAELALLHARLDPEHSRWGFGWFVNEDGADTWLSISGATPGVQAGLAVYPSCGLVTVALANAWGKNSAGGDLVIGAPRRAAAELVDCPSVLDADGARR